MCKQKQASGTRASTSIPVEAESGGNRVREPGQWGLEVAVSGEKRAPSRGGNTDTSHQCISGTARLGVTGRLQSS